MHGLRKLTNATLFTVMLAAGWVALPGQAGAVALKCTKSGKTISDLIASLKPATGYTEIDISGACTDNIYIPPNQAISLVATNGTTLTPANAAVALITVEGRLQVANLAMTTGNFTAIFANRGGYATLEAGTITGTGTGVQVSDNSGALIQDTAITLSGSAAAVNTYAGGNVEIDGIANLYGRNVTTLTSSGSGGDGITCNSGSVTLNTGGGGSIDITGNGENGIYSAGCKLVVFATASNPLTIEKTGMLGQFSSGINMSGGSASLSGTFIINNSYFGMFVSENAFVQVAGNGTAITGNAGQAMNAAQGAVIHIVPYNGVNTITEPNGNTQTLFGCYQGGAIEVDQIANTITPAPTQQNIGCLTVGGP